jgi:uncharacterized membrane protein
MTDRVIQGAAIASAVGALVVSGVFFAFSNFVMPALARLPGDRAVTAMNAINVTVVNFWFMTLLFGTAILGMASAGLSITRGGRLDDWPLLVATILYVVGCIVITMAFNVPLNDALATSGGASPSTLATTDRWQHYLLEWTRWNTVRALASCASGIFYVVASIRFLG